MRTTEVFVVLAALGAAACREPETVQAAQHGAEAPRAASSTSTPEATSAAAPMSAPSAASANDGPDRVYEARKGAERVLLVRTVPGPLFDSNAPPPPNGAPVPPHPFLSARCTGDAMFCSHAGALLRASSSVEQFLDRLRGEGLSVGEVHPGNW